MSSQLRNDPLKVALASMVGTAIEFFDYYIYAAAAVLVFNTLYLGTLVIRLVVRKPWSPLWF